MGLRRGMVFGVELLRAERNLGQGENTEGV